VLMTSLVGCTVLKMSLSGRALQGARNPRRAAAGAGGVLLSAKAFANAVQTLNAQRSNARCGKRAACGTVLAEGGYHGYQRHRLGRVAT
jgi:hypothetical protein